MYKRKTIDIFEIVGNSTYSKNEVIDSFNSYKEAIKMLKEYRLCMSDFNLYIKKSRQKLI